MRFRVITYNVHKGFSIYNRFILPKLREAIRSENADLVILQEICGAHPRQNDLKTRNLLTERDPSSQVEYLADTVWSDYAYGQNAIYSAGHHGNAILSRYIIKRHINKDISSSQLERRGFLHAEIEVGGMHIHVISLHLSLLHRDRRTQFKTIVDYLSSQVGENDRVVIGGDFNDWGLKARALFAEPLHLKEAFQEFKGREAKTFPIFFPILPLDRIYYRGFELREARRLIKKPWSKLSDHCALYAEFEMGAA